MGFDLPKMPLFFPVSAPIFIESLAKKDTRASEKSPVFLSAFLGKALEVFINNGCLTVIFRCAMIGLAQLRIFRPASIYPDNIVVVKKTFRYSDVFFYNPLCRNSVIRNIIMESGTNSDLKE
jgi:hypothetical protein